ncbi:MAG TPA: hypothetical protein VFE65_27095, partial [Pseudonocardia sp.]|nr:hypothetical protein [Pseudonocardia sp.]
TSPRSPLSSTSPVVLGKITDRRGWHVADSTAIAGGVTEASVTPPAAGGRIEAGDVGQRGSGRHLEGERRGGLGPDRL